MIKSTVVAATLVTACFLVVPQYALAEYVKCNNQVTGTEIGSIEYVSSECTRSDGTTYFQSQTHLDLMSAGANRPSEDPVVQEVEVVDVVVDVVVDDVVDDVVDPDIAKLAHQFSELNRYHDRKVVMKVQYKGKKLARKLKWITKQITKTNNKIIELVSKVHG